MDFKTELELVNQDGIQDAQFQVALLVKEDFAHNATPDFTSKQMTTLAMLVQDFLVTLQMDLPTEPELVNRQTMSAQLLIAKLVLVLFVLSVLETFSETKHKPLVFHARQKGKLESQDSEFVKQKMSSQLVQSAAAINVQELNAQNASLDFSWTKPAIVVSLAQMLAKFRLATNALFKQILAQFQIAKLAQEMFAQNVYQDFTET